MKLPANISSARRQWNRLGFTLLEMMFSVGIYTVLIVGAMIAIQIFALRCYTLAATKISATQMSRKALNQIRNDIRQGKYVQVGSADNFGNFTPFSGATLASGNALQVFSLTNSDNSNGVWVSPPYSIYYLQTNSPGGVSSNNLVWLSVTSTSTNAETLATYITNMDLFTTENCYGQTVSNIVQNNWLYDVKMQFYQWEYPIAVISSNNAPNAYDYYQLRTRVGRRALN